MNSSFTPRETVLINIIKKGCEHIIKNFSKRIESPEQYANLRMHTKVKPSMRTFVIFEVITIFQENPREKFRRNDIVLRFPDNLKKCYYDSELTRILQHLVKLNLIVHIPYQPEKRRPGRSNFQAVSGPKSYYEASPFLITLNRLLDNQEAKNMIYNYLIDSKIIFSLYEISFLISLYFKTHNIEAIKNARQIVKLTRTKTELELEEEFNDYYKKLEQMNKKEVIQEAKIWANEKLSILTANDFLWLYPIGAVYYYSEIVNQILGFNCPESIND